jgi:hypothetical protein
VNQRGARAGVGTKYTLVVLFTSKDASCFLLDPIMLSILYFSFFLPYTFPIFLVQTDTTTRKNRRGKERPQLLMSIIHDSMISLRWCRKKRTHVDEGTFLLLICPMPIHQLCRPEFAALAMSSSRDHCRIVRTTD